MHFVISWEMKADGEQQNEIDNAMLAGLAGYAWIRLLSAFYILDIDTEQDWHVIQGRLLAVAQRYSGKVNFLMSPMYEFDSDYFVYQIPDKGYYQT
jgi:hypothetical protein